ncbi:MAG: hypothetical protein NT135_01795 [Candidatus Berkelbacteria bacterium]|nr:hypothetical protein [Candidatus Berkelbacteria bacterium]
MKKRDNREGLLEEEPKVMVLETSIMGPNVAHILFAPEGMGLYCATYDSGSSELFEIPHDKDAQLMMGPLIRLAQEHIVDIVIISLGGNKQAMLIIEVPYTTKQRHGFDIHNIVELFSSHLEQLTLQ